MIKEKENKDDIFDEEKQPPKAMKTGFVNGNRLNTDDFEELEEVAEPKKDSKLSFAILLSIFLAVNLLAVMLFAFDVGKIRTKFLTFQSTAINNNAMKENLDAQQQKINAEKQAVEQEKNRLEQEEERQRQKEEELSTRQRELDDQKAAHESTPAPNVVLDPSAVEPDSKILIAVKLYEGMEAKNAAKIIASLEITDQVNLIKNMKKSKASEILTAMDSNQSSRIMKEIIK